MVSFVQRVGATGGIEMGCMSAESECSDAGAEVTFSKVEIGAATGAGGGNDEDS